MLKDLTSVFNCASTICKLVILCTIIKTLIAENVTSDCVFSSSPQQINEATANTDFDAYVTYRSDQHDQFSWSLLKEILLEEQRNVITSPFSVKLVLALLSEAAGNNTKTQKKLYTTMKDIRSQLNLRSFYKMILSSLKKKNPYYTLNLETKLYADELIEPQQKYAAMLHTFYDTHIENLQFSDSETSVDTINKWCRNVTNGRLPQLVNEDNIQNSVLLMANVIYFSGIWRRQFNNTFQGVFFKSPNEQLKVDFMEQTEYFYYYDSVTLDAKILRLPYEGRKLSMFILLPKTKAGLDELTNDLEIDQLKRMQWMMDEVKVKVTMPKFNFDFDKDIKETLIKLGLNEIFTYNASLAGLARGIQVAKNLKVSNIFQKAGIDVNENGTEAFAATVVEIENKFGGSSLIEEFNVNRPFISFIEEEATGIIFAGKVLEPVTQ